MRTLLALSMIAAVIPLPLAAAAPDDYIVASDATVQFGDDVTLVARYLDPEWGCPPAGCPEGGREINFFVDGEYIGSDVTNVGGWAYLRIADSSASHVGAHTITITYDTWPNGALVDTATLVVTPETTELVAREGYVEARLTDDDGNALSGKLVRFSYVTALGEQNICDAYTDADGVASCASENGAGVTPLDLAETSYKATFDGTADFFAATDNGALL